jgi:hypothetical protein
MAHRTFTDRSGTHWDVWDVVPQWADRRAGSERRRLSVDEVPDPPVLNQRAGDDRRRPDSSDRVPRVKIAGDFSGGWLAFESPGERRRLSPIPPQWEFAPEEELARWCANASAAPKRRLIE